MSLAWLTRPGVRLSLLLGVLVALTAYAATTWTGVLGGNATSLSQGASNCPFIGAPSVGTASRAELLRLREELKPVAAVAGEVRPYEEGIVLAGAAWSDAEPGNRAPTALPIRGPSGYEMRWWMPAGEDLAADALVFPSPAQAADFLGRATSTKCRAASTAARTSIPPGGWNLEWKNPEGFAQEDVFLRRGARVYRVVVVMPGAGAHAEPATRRRAFRGVNLRACSLPHAACRLRRQSRSR